MALRSSLHIHLPPADCISGAQPNRRSAQNGLSLKRAKVPKLVLQSAISPRAHSQNSSILTEELLKSGGESNADQFMFHTEGGGQVRVFLGKQASKYTVKLEVTMTDSRQNLHLHWGLFRSDSADWVLLEPENAPPNTIFLNGKNEAMQSPMQLCASGLQTLQLELASDMVPFYISFVLYRPAREGYEELWIKSVSGSNFCVPIGVRVGHPDPLGVTFAADGSANFALYSKNAANVTLCLYGVHDVEPALEIDLERVPHRTGDIWHVELPSIEGFVRYGYRCKGEEIWDNGNRFHKRRILLDPYSKFIAPPVPGQEELPSPAIALGWLQSPLNEFDWEDDAQPRISLERVVAYRLDIAGFTEDSSSGVSERLRGTYMGLIEKISHFQRLGVNTIILQPIFEFDKSQGHCYPISFFSPTDAYDSARDSLTASTSLKEMVKSLHKNGIEVILDVVFCYTAEQGDDSPETISFRGIDSQTYYILDQHNRVLQSASGGGNTFNCNHPAVHKMIVDSLRHWVEEYHVDGFCFVNAPDLVKGPHGELLTRPLLLEAITFDPVLANSKLFAEAISPLNGVVDKSLQFPHWRRWCEWNTNFHDDVRDFFRGNEGKLSDFATRLCGSGDIFADGRGPNFSLNYVAHAYGLTLSDSVIYSRPEETASATSSRKSSGTYKTRETQVRQVRNLLVSLFLSQGVPVLTMGDEYGHSNDGKAGKTRRFDWVKLEAEEDFCDLISSLSVLRTQYKYLLQRGSYIEPKNIKWHGSQAGEEPLWNDPSSSFLAVSFDSPDGGASDLCLAFNAENGLVKLNLPELPEGMAWLRIADTSLPHPETLTLNGSPVRSQTSYEVQPSSVVVLRAAYNDSLGFKTS